MPEDRVESRAETNRLSTTEAVDDFAAKQANDARKIRNLHNIASTLFGASAGVTAPLALVSTRPVMFGIAAGLQGLAAVASHIAGREPVR